MSEELKPITAADAGFDADEPNARGILILTGVTVILFVVLLAGITYYFNYVHDQEEYLKVLAPPSQQLKELHARENWQLEHYSYADRAKGQVRIPIARAMELLAREAAGGKLPYGTANQPVKAVAPVPAVTSAAPPAN